MTSAAERAAQLDLVARLKSGYPELPDAPTPDLLDHNRFVACMKPVHDVGGEPDAPMKSATSTWAARCIWVSRTTVAGCCRWRGC